MLVSLGYLLFRRALAVAALRLRSREFKEVEIVVLAFLLVGAFDAVRGIVWYSLAVGMFVPNALDGVSDSWTMPLAESGLKTTTEPGEPP